MGFHLTIFGVATAAIVAIVFGLYCLWTRADSALVGKIVLTSAAAFASIVLFGIAIEHGWRVIRQMASRSSLNQQSTINRKS